MPTLAGAGLVFGGRIRYTEGEKGSIFMSTTLLDEHAMLTLIQKHLLPHLLQQHPEPAAPVRIWSIGCQSGDEALLLLLRLVSTQGAPASPARFTLFATDPDATAVNQARQLASSTQLQAHPSLA